MKNLSSRLKNKLIIYDKVAAKNELLEDVFIYKPIKTVWGEIINWGGSSRNTTGDVVESSTSHRIIIRNTAIKNVTEDMYFVHKGIRYDVEYYNPCFKDGSFLEFLVKRVNGTLAYE
ncbi:head-tail adaptor protein [Clostridium botulinum]|uniref:Head-tail adaptor protein n=1 Tax=Clostridium botulinum TaxID=1491 RepID=A0A6M0SPZ1_CLOBO|nr:head-tail adaptor protein [Clostridium botulinum]NFO35141.1 head-tail adaptor protein [Clostridium botulinum]NFO48381.1 head-tail adaptor protein [Clostridium botulinum]NFO58648.1 head-tail adaptor protein [Clostridium botulinum]